MAARENEYDLIVIGSGIGGLTVASLAAQLRKQRVLVLEQHFKPGGFTHAFRREQYHWDVGIHYVGQLQTKSPLRQLVDLVTGGEVSWSAMADPYDRFVYPEITFDMRVGVDRVEADLIERFPSEAAGIRRYLRDLQRAAHGFTRWTMQQNASRVARGYATVMQWCRRSPWRMTTEQYLDQYLQDPVLKSLLVSQWADYGLPPARSAFGIHAIVATHYFAGGWYPEGGGGTIAAAVKKIIEEQGGKALVSRRVTQVLIENGRAVGVQAAHANSTENDPVEEYRAPVIVSNTGSYTTYAKLIPEATPIPFRNTMQTFLNRNPPMSNVTLYLGLSGDPRSLGFHGENHWIFANGDHNSIPDRAAAWPQTRQPPMAFLSFPSIKDPQATAHTAEIISPINYERFLPWREQPWKNRDADYQSLKAQLAHDLIAFVEDRNPGFSQLVDYQELSTPLTNEYFTGHAGGAVYGVSCVPERFTEENRCWLHPRTPVPGLFQTGADVCSPGIVGAMLGGVTTLGYLPRGASIMRVFAAAYRAARKS